MDGKDETNDDCFIENDVDFCSFYYKAVQRLLDFSDEVNISHLLRFAKIFNDYFDNFCQVKWDLDDKDETMLRLLRNSLYYRIVYIYRNATLLSSAVAFHLRNVFEKNPKIIRTMRKKKLVNICSLGGCSVPDIVAVIKVLKSFAQETAMELDFRVTIIDFTVKWKNTCIAVLNCLEEFQGTTCKINFIPCNLANTNRWTPKTLKAVRKANIITMVNYISKFDNKSNILKMICNKMQTDAILFTLDRPFTKLIELYIGITNLGNFQLLDVELCDYHALDIEAVNHSKTLYHKHFGNEKLLRSNIGCNLFVSVWIKASSETDTRYLDNIERLFETSVEKFNPKQSLNNNYTSAWEHLFRKQKEAAGWSAKKIKSFIQNQKGKRNDMLGKIISGKKGIESLQNRLLTNIASSENDEEEFSEANEDLLEDYLKYKREYSAMKKSAYFATFKAKNL